MTTDTLQEEPTPTPVEESTGRLRRAWDNLVRGVTAGLSPAELRAIFRGEGPTEKPNPRYRLHTNSFVFHVRPRHYLAGSTWFHHTFRLGMISVFLFAIEIVTGLILMLYYAPTPGEAYASILRLDSEVAFGSYLRDVHRLAAELMVAVVFLHMLRTYLTGSYKGPRKFTWLTGVLLLLVTLLLAFSGYLLPWDQLAYWAVTIGTSMVAAAPVIGPQLNVLLRGAADIGSDGLLRFYLLHVVLLPLAGIVLLSIHYYKVARTHGISLPANIEEGDPPPELKERAMRRIPFLPDLFTHEILWLVAVTLVLVGASVFFYDAPLESHADPRHTPLETRAPWFFLWVQGLLKLGDKTLMGVIIPALVVVLLLALPYLDRNPSRRARRRPIALALAGIGLVALVVLSYMGTPDYGIHQAPAVEIVQNLAPEEGDGPLHLVPYDDLPPGIYEVNQTEAGTFPQSLAEVYSQFEAAVLEASEAAMPDANAFMVIEERQPNLKAVTLRISWQEPDRDARSSYEEVVYLHRNRFGPAPEVGTVEDSGQAQDQSQEHDQEQGT